MRSVTKEDFVNWYFSGELRTELFLIELASYLKADIDYHITAESLFESCSAIPNYITQEYRDGEEEKESLIPNRHVILL